MQYIQSVVQASNLPTGDMRSRRSMGTCSDRWGCYLELLVGFCRWTAAGLQNFVENPCNHLKRITILLRNTFWTAIILRRVWMLDHGPALKLPYDMSCLSWTGHCLIHQAIKLSMQSSTLWSSGSGMWFGSSRPWRHKLLGAAPMFMVPTLAMLPSLSHPVLIVLWGILYSQLAEEERTQARFTDGSTWYVGTIQKWTAVTLQTLSGRSLKDSSEWKSSHWAEIQEKQLVVHFTHKER